MNEQLTLEVHPKNPRARVRILSGTDDGSPYRVTVPLRIRTIEDAVAWLRPPEVTGWALRQGDLFFQPMPTGWKPSSLAEDTYTEAGSERHVEVRTGPGVLGRHRIERGDLGEDKAVSRMVQAHGETCFLGRRAVKSHAWTGRPRYFVRGRVTHPEHAPLELGYVWHEVIRNRASGPWPVEGIWGGD